MIYLFTSISKDSLQIFKKEYLDSIEVKPVYFTNPILYGPEYKYYIWKINDQNYKCIEEKDIKSWHSKEDLQELFKNTISPSEYRADITYKYSTTLVTDYGSVCFYDSFTFNNINELKREIKDDKWNNVVPVDFNFKGELEEDYRMKISIEDLTIGYILSNDMLKMA